MLSSIRSQHDPYPYRSAPSTPMAMDPRTISTMDMNQAMNQAMNHARMGLEIDYFSAGGTPRSAAVRPRSPYPPPPPLHDYEATEGVGYTRDAFGGGAAEMSTSNLSTLVCRYFFQTLNSNQHSSPNPLNSN